LIGKSWEEVEGRTDLELLHDKVQATTVMANDRKVIEEGCTKEMEELMGTGGGRPRVWLSTKTPLRGEDGHIEGLVGVSVEITERKRTEERLRLMVHELNHRVKNTLATVQAIAVQTLRASDTAVVGALLSRLQALAAAHDVLTRESWQEADLCDVVASALAAHGGAESGRFLISGPPVKLLPREAVALAMALHELATNALKYGALSPNTPLGRVELNWTDNGGRLCLVWKERGGPLVSPPTRRGFGTRLIERSLSQDLEGEITLAFEPEGVTCTVDAALGAALLDRGQVSALLEVGAS
jgi:two-component sensor histidine kinase